VNHEVNLEMLKLTYTLLEELSEQVVFVGGITTCLYIDVDIADDIRPTTDVDCVIEIANKKEYDKFQKKLRAKGFTHDMRVGAPLCRFRHGDLLVLDVMPNDEEILGFSNSWYKEGILNKEKFHLTKDDYIYIFPLALFIASKFEAFNGRGRKDPRMSWDLEDIVLVIDGIKNFQIPTLQGRLKEFLIKMTTECLTDKTIQEAISGFLNNSTPKINRLNERLRQLT